MSPRASYAMAFVVVVQMFVVVFAAKLGSWEEGLSAIAPAAFGDAAPWMPSVVPYDRQNRSLSVSFGTTET